jgi:RNA polymerase sigma factor (sigma-70 family)
VTKKIIEKKLSCAARSGVDRDVSAETALIARLKAGDAAAFDEVYAAYHGRIYAFLARMVQRRDVAEDLLQDTWMRLAAHAARLRDDTQISAWLFAVARNRCRSYHRWRILDSERVDELTLARYRSDQGETPFDAAAASQLETRLEAAIAALPPRYREVVLLIAVERMTPGEAAEVLGLKPDTLRQRLLRARDMITRSLGDALERPPERKAS